MTKALMQIFDITVKQIIKDKMNEEWLSLASYDKKFQEAEYAAKKLQHRIHSIKNSLLVE